MLSPLEEGCPPGWDGGQIHPTVGYQTHCVGLVSVTRALLALTVWASSGLEPGFSDQQRNAQSPGHPGSPGDGVVHQCFVLACLVVSGTSLGSCICVVLYCAISALRHWPPQNISTILLALCRSTLKAFHSLITRAMMPALSYVH